MSFALDQYMGIARQRESGGNDNAKNKLSSASGRYQFITPTYLQYARKANPGVPDDQLLARKNDPQVQEATMRAFTADNVSMLQRNGITPSNGSAYAAHFLGPAGAVRALKADPNTPIDQVVDAAALRANPQVFRNIRTAGDFANWTNNYKGVASDPNSGPAGGMALSGDGPTTSLADLPADGAAEAGGPPAQPGFWEGGPGALFGMPQKDWNAGDAMLGVGAALMARDNPTGASALSALATKAKASQGAKSVVKVDSQTGMVTRYDPTTDTFKNYQVFPRSKELDDPSGGDRKMFQENHMKANAHSMLADTFDRARRELATGDIDLSLASKIKQSASELFNLPLTEQQKRTARFLLDMENARADILRTFPGVQTEGDAKRAMDMLRPGGIAGLSNDNAMEAMERGFAHSTRNYSDQLKYNESLYKKFGDRIGPSDYGDSNAARQRAFAEAEETYRPLKESYVKKRTEGAATQTKQITGRPQDAQAAPPTTGMSLYDAFKNRK